MMRWWGTDDICVDDDEHFEERPDHNSECEKEADEMLQQDSDAGLQSVSTNNIIKFLCIKQT